MSGAKPTDKAVIHYVQSSKCPSGSPRWHLGCKREPSRCMGSRCYRCYKNSLGKLRGTSISHYWSKQISRPESDSNWWTLGKDSLKFFCGTCLPKPIKILTSYSHSSSGLFDWKSDYRGRSYHLMETGRFPVVAVVKVSESCSVLSASLWPHGLYSPWNSPG